MRKYFGLIILSLLIILVSCKVKNQGYDNEYYFYKGYNIVDKNLLVELDYSNNDYYLKFKEQVSLSLGELKFIRNNILKVIKVSFSTQLF